MGWLLDCHVFSLSSIFGSVFPLDSNISGFKNLSYMGGTMMQLWVMTVYWRICLQVLYPLDWILLLKSSTLHPGSLSPSWTLGLSCGYPHFPISTAFLSVQLSVLSPLSFSTCTCPSFLPSCSSIPLRFLLSSSSIAVFYIALIMFRYGLEFLTSPMLSAWRGVLICQKLFQHPMRRSCRFFVGLTLFT